MLVTIDGTKYEGIGEAGEKVIVSERCIKCDGTGYYYHYGVCFSCGGTGRHHKSRKLYTPEQQQKLEEKKIRTRDLKKQKHRDILSAKKAHIEELKVKHAEIWDFIKDSRDAFLSGLRHHLENGNDFAEKQIEVAKKAIEDERQLPVSDHIGEIGERRDFTGKIIKIVTGENHWGFWQIVTLDCDGNQIVYKGKSHLGSKGETVKFKATIKSHDFFREQKQTQINRPKEIK